MFCIGILVAYCLQPDPIAVSDFCRLVEPLVREERYKPSRSDHQRSKNRYAALKTRYERLCKDKVMPK